MKDRGKELQDSEGNFFWQAATDETLILNNRLNGYSHTAARRTGMYQLHCTAY